MAVDVQSEVSQKMTNLNISELKPLPDFIQNRQQLWEKFKVRHEAELAENQSKSVEITVNAKNKDGQLREVKGKSWFSSPLEIAKQIAPKSWCDTLVISKVDGVLWDLERPLEKDCSLELLTFDSDEGN